MLNALERDGIAKRCKYTLNLLKDVKKSIVNRFLRLNWLKWWYSEKTQVHIELTKRYEKIDCK